MSAFCQRRSNLFMEVTCQGLSGGGALSQTKGARLQIVTVPPKRGVLKGGFQPSNQQKVASSSSLGYLQVT